MPILESVFTTDRRTGSPELQLTYKINNFDQNPKYITIKKLRSINDFHSGRIPAYYSLDKGDLIGQPLNIPPRPPSITIIAAPGVSVETRGFPDNWIASLANPGLNVFRVQNPRLVPTIGGPYSASALTSDYFVDTRPPPYMHTSATDSGQGSPSQDMPEQLSEVEESDWAQAYGRLFDSRLASKDEVDNYRANPLAFLHRDEIIRTELDLMRLRDLGLPIDFSIDYLMSVSLLQIAHQPDGAIFTHPYSGQALFIKVPSIHRRLAGSSNRHDHEARFAYRINPGNPNLTYGIFPLVSIVKSGNVSVTLSSIESGLVNSGSQLRDRYRRSLVFFEIHDTNFDNVPPQGAPLPTRRIRRTRRINFVPSPLLAISQTFMDIGIGLIPYVGDAADIAEFWYALSTDTDKWGGRVSTLEKVIMGVGALLPLVGSAALRAGPRLARAFGRHRRAAQRLGAALEQSGYTQEEREFLLEVSDTLKRGRRLSYAQLQRASDLIRRIGPCTA